MQIKFITDYIHILLMRILLDDDDDDDDDDGTVMIIQSLADGDRNIIKFNKE